MKPFIFGTIFTLLVAQAAFAGGGEGNGGEGSGGQGTHGAGSGNEGNAFPLMTRLAISGSGNEGNKTEGHELRTLGGAIG